MDIQSKKFALTILGLASLILSRAIFALIDDPEGPNLPIVAVLAAVLFSLSLGVHKALLFLRKTGPK